MELIARPVFSRPTFSVNPIHCMFSLSATLTYIFLPRDAYA